MDSGDLTSEQVKVLQEQLRPTFLYLQRLVGRMEKCGFNRQDEIYKAASDSYDRVFGLNVRLHYLCCDAQKREREAERKAKGEPFRPGWS